jgi:hypothetical protein
MLVGDKGMSYRDVSLGGHFGSKPYWEASRVVVTGLMN